MSCQHLQSFTNRGNEALDAYKTIHANLITPWTQNGLDRKAKVSRLIQSGSYGFEIGWASHTEPNYWVGKTYSFAQNLPDYLAIFKLLGGQLPTLPPHNYPIALIGCDFNQRATSNSAFTAFLPPTRLLDLTSTRLLGR